MAFRLEAFEIQASEVWRFSYTLYGKIACEQALSGIMNIGEIKNK